MENKEELWITCLSNETQLNPNVGSRFEVLQVSKSEAEARQFMVGWLLGSTTGGLIHWNMATFGLPLLAKDDWHTELKKAYVGPGIYNLEAPIRVLNLSVGAKLVAVFRGQRIESHDYMTWERRNDVDSASRTCLEIAAEGYMNFGQNLRSQ